MKKMLKIIRYQLSDTKKAIIIYYSILICIVLMFAYLRNSGTVSFGKGDGNRDFIGFSISTMIFLFVSGLNSFKVNFKFLQAHGISRTTQYKSSILTFALLTAFMACVSLISVNIINLLIPYQTLHNSIFPEGTLIQNFVWTFSAYFFCVTIGWFITMLYYRCGKLMKTLISLLPVFIIILLSVANNLTDGRSSVEILDLMRTGMGLKDGNSMTGALSFFMLSAVSLFFSYLLIRKAPLKD